MDYKLAAEIVKTLLLKTKGPKEAIGVVDQIIGILSAMDENPDNFPKESGTTFIVNGRKFIVETKVSRIQ